jgi:hypothetical protein
MSDVLGGHSSLGYTILLLVLSLTHTIKIAMITELCCCVVAVLSLESQICPYVGKLYRPAYKSLQVECSNVTLDTTRRGHCQRTAFMTKITMCGALMIERTLSAALMIENCLK